jgi:type IV pilus assembly protein PilV
MSYATLAPRRGARRQRGVSLVEILVTMVLMAVGLLGLAGLQARGLQVNQGSLYRSTAEIMVEDLADRLRAVLDTGAAPGAIAIATFTGGAGGAFTPASNPSGLDPSLANWLATSLAQLPGGPVPGGVAVPCGASLPCLQVGVGTGYPVDVTLDVYWNDTRATQGGSPTAGLQGASPVGSYHLATAL